MISVQIGGRVSITKGGGKNAVAGSHSLQLFNVFNRQKSDVDEEEEEEEGEGEKRMGKTKTICKRKKKNGYKNKFGNCYSMDPRLFIHSGRFGFHHFLAIFPLFLLLLLLLIVIAYIENLLILINTCFQSVCVCVCKI